MNKSGDRIEMTSDIFERLSRLAVWAKRLLMVYAITLIVIAINDYTMWRFLNQAAEGHFSDMAQLEAAGAVLDSRTELLSMAALCVYLMTLVIIAKWIMQANRHARSLGANLKYSAGWSVGWYFVPIFNLWRPYQAMKEIWYASASASPDAATLIRGSNKLQLWWGFWIWCTLINGYMFRLHMRSEEISEMLWAYQLDFLSLPIGLLSCWTMFLLMESITSTQRQKAGIEL